MKPKDYMNEPYYDTLRKCKECLQYTSSGVHFISEYTPDTPEYRVLRCIMVTSPVSNFIIPKHIGMRLVTQEVRNNVELYHARDFTHSMSMTFEEHEKHRQHIDNMSFDEYTYWMNLTDLYKSDAHFDITRELTRIHRFW